MQSTTTTSCTHEQHQQGLRNMPHCKLCIIRYSALTVLCGVPHKACNAEYRIMRSK